MNHTANTSAIFIGQVTEPAFDEIHTVEDLDGGVTEKRTEYEKVRFKIHRTGCKKTYVSKVQHIRS